MPGTGGGPEGARFLLAGGAGEYEAGLGAQLACGRPVSSILGACAGGTGTVGTGRDVSADQAPVSTGRLGEEGRGGRVLRDIERPT